LFFDGSGPTYPDPLPLCARARADRWRDTAAIALVGVVLAGAADVARRISTRRADVDQLSATPATCPRTIPAERFRFCGRWRPHTEGGF
jgi:hypothetical protein